MLRREGAGRDARVAGTGDGVEVRIVGLAKPGAVGDETVQPLRPLLLISIDEIGAQLIDDDQDDRLRRASVCV